ncbi:MULTISPECIES: hypothetical protein [Inquilinus]|uniref:Uncharacterized protein n=1 Tax=Inquilinus ginsengisoli TaxID=363840 RepID=A0ABU1JN11_9PROT|nr:hypothetical protein [Inquilinus ginsengisoli]MDR6290002.1 hypothetical protein [Inquilinus ginsengisoli]
MRIANISPGPRFLYAQGQARLIEPGAVADLDLTEAEIANARQQVEAGLLAWADRPRNPDAPTVVHKRFGQYHIVGVDGEVLQAGPFSKVEAEAELARMLGRGA